MFDGFISLNELSWIKKPPHPSKIVSLNDNVDVKILEIDSEKKRLVCSLKQMRENPWKKLEKPPPKRGTRKCRKICKFVINAFLWWKIFAIYSNILLWFLLEICQPFHF